MKTTDVVSSVFTYPQVAQLASARVAQQRMAAMAQLRAVYSPDRSFSGGVSEKTLGNRFITVVNADKV